MDYKIFPKVVPNADSREVQQLNFAHLLNFYDDEFYTFLCFHINNLNVIALCISIDTAHKSAW